MPRLPPSQANLLQSLALAASATGEIVLDATIFAKYSYFRIVNFGDTINVIPTDAASSAFPDAQQTALFSGEGFVWRPRSDEQRLAFLNSGVASTTIYVYAIHGGL